MAADPSSSSHSLSAVAELCPRRREQDRLSVLVQMLRHSWPPPDLLPLHKKAIEQDACYAVGFRRVWCHFGFRTWLCIILHHQRSHLPSMHNFCTRTLAQFVLNNDHVLIGQGWCVCAHCLILIFLTPQIQESLRGRVTARYDKQAVLSKWTSDSLRERNDHHL